MKDQAFELIKESLNEIKSDISVIKKDNIEIMKTMVVNTNSLKEHMRRTDTLERHVTVLETSIEEVKTFAYKYDSFIKVLKVIPIVVLCSSIVTIFIWINIEEGTKTFILKWLSNSF